MNNYKIVADEILFWLEKYNKQAEDPDKYSLIHQRILNKKIDFKDINNILVVGGNNCTSEQKLIKSIKLNNCNITSYDLIKPKSLNFSNINEIKWVSKNVDEQSNFNNKIFDMVICLATSRLFEDTFKVYSNVLGSLKKGALILIDFYDLPIIRRKSTNIMNKWLISEWKKNPKSAIKKLDTIAKISKELSISLNKKDIFIEDSIPEFGISSGSVFLQSLIYETIFPFWFKKNATIEEIRAILIYQFLSISNNCTKLKIKKFSKLNSLQILELYKFTNDTNILIGTKL